MATPSAIQRTKTALRTILDTHASVVAITGRPRGNCRPWRTNAKIAPLPCVLYQIVSATKQNGSTGLTWTVLVQITCLGEGETGAEIAGSLAEAVETALIVPAFTDAGLDAMVTDSTTTESEEDDDTRTLYRSDLTLELWITQ